VIELLNQIDHWHWLAFGLALLCVEILGAAGYFLWLGLSALLVGLLISLLPLGWQMQWLSFASFSLITTWLWWRYQQKKDHQDDKTNTLNRRTQQLIGETVTLDEPFPTGKGRIRLGDTTWSAVSEQMIEVGTLVEVHKVDGINLHIRPKL
jgi:membrane protein implicated in regulation of membrane protease activity